MSRDLQSPATPSQAGVPELEPVAAPATSSAIADFELGLDRLDAMAPHADASAAGQWLEQAQASLADGFDLQKHLEQMPQNMSVVETNQFLMGVQKNFYSAQMLMSLLHTTSNKIQKTAEALLPKTG
ncbi:MAG: hypothetical protein KA795_03360 [Burkholderiaceae bacterium]|nr:hypothetical protein [Burkholderiaceae bacterium]